MPERSLISYLLKGGLGFGLASLCVFATVAFAERWMYDRLGLFGAYAAWTLLFILLGGASLRPLADRSWRGGGFFALFGAAFFLYAVGWMTAYFTLGGAAGEWAGSLAGSVLMGVAFAAGFGVVRAAPAFAVVLFLANSIGYFLGSAINTAVGGRPGMLLWGLVYGLSLGAGMGAVLSLSQSRHGADPLPRS